MPIPSLPGLLLICAALPFWSFLSRAEAQTHFKDCITRVTGSDATVIIPAEANPNIDGVPLAEGSEIVAFTTDGTCAGVTVWNGETLTLTIRGDDSQTSVKDGFAGGETITFRLWDAGRGIEVGSGENEQITFKLDGSQPHFRTTATFAADAIYRLTSISAMTSVGIEAPEDANMDTGSLDEAFPNPFTGHTSFEITIGTPGRVTMNVYDVRGRVVGTLIDDYLAVGRYTAVLEADELPAGLYFCMLRVGGHVAVRAVHYLK